MFRKYQLFFATAGFGVVVGVLICSLQALQSRRDQRASRPILSAESSPLVSVPSTPQSTKAEEPSVTTTGSVPAPPVAETAPPAQMLSTSALAQDSVPIPPPIPASDGPVKIVSPAPANMEVPTAQSAAGSPPQSSAAPLAPPPISPGGDSSAATPPPVGALALPAPTPTLVDRPSPPIQDLPPTPPRPSEPPLAAQLVPSSAPAVEAASCPWTFQVTVADGRTQLEASNGGDMQLMVICDHLEMQTPKGFVRAEGNVCLRGPNVEGSCKRLTLAWNDDRVQLEGVVSLKCQDIDLTCDKLSVKLATVETLPMPAPAE